MRVSLYAVLILSLLASPTVFAETLEQNKADHRPSKVDANGDGFLSREEMEAHNRKKLDRVFERTDTDKDGKLSQDELQKGREQWRAKMQHRFEKMKEKQGLAQGKKPE